MRAVPVLLGMGRRGRSPRPTSARGVAVVRKGGGRRALRDARDDVFQDGDGGAGNRVQTGSDMVTTVNYHSSGSL